MGRAWARANGLGEHEERTFSFLGRIIEANSRSLREGRDPGARPSQLRKRDRDLRGRTG
jgi:hypothetical protein